MRGNITEILDVMFGQLDISSGTQFLKGNFVGTTFSHGHWAAQAVMMLGTVSRLTQYTKPLIKTFDQFLTACVAAGTKAVKFSCCCG